MKKKSSSIAQTAKAEKNVRREYPYFCSPATETTPLSGMALRVIVSDIRKHKTGDDRLEKPAAEFADKTTGNE